MNLPDLRLEYGRETLNEVDVSLDPFEQFQLWFDDAIARGLHEPNAMTLATTSANGRPSARIVLLKGFDSRGFTFFTNYQSRKGIELAENPFAALVFFFPTLERQIRVEGRVQPISSEESDAYYLSRPIGSRSGAWASNQSQVIADRSTLDLRLAEIERRAALEALPRPPHWGGLRVVPDALEFWQGRPNRMHDRLRYRSVPTGWTIERLEP